MSNSERALALKILRRHWRRSFFNARNISEYISAVTLRLNQAGIKSVPQTPETFLRFCQKLGLYQRRPINIRFERKGVK